MKFNLNEKLSELKQHFNPQAAFMRTLQSMIPKILPQIKPTVKAHFDEIQKPIAEGGALKEGENTIVYIVSFIDDKMILSQCGVRFQNDVALLSEPNFAIDGEQFLEGFLNAQNNPSHE